jgi:hypothetical protein
MSGIRLPTRTHPSDWERLQEVIRTSLQAGISVYVYPLPEPSYKNETGHNGYATTERNLKKLLGWGELRSEEVLFEGRRYKLHWVTDPFYPGENLVAQCFGMVGIRGGIVISPLDIK